MLSGGTGAGVLSGTVKVTCILLMTNFKKIC